jgi:protein tyrosine/serine phosphatase
MAIEHDRSLNWDGLLNGRELGGIHTAHGPILPGRLVRSASVHTLSAAGWQELVDHGIRTVMDLRDGREVDEAAVPGALHRAEVALLHQPLEPSGYVQAWSEREDRWKLSSPFYFDEFMTEHASRVGTAIKTIVATSPGGVLVHCFTGKDRAGLTIAMMLDLLGVDHATIIADHWVSFDRARSLESEFGKAESPDKPAPDREIYAAVLGDLLAAHPSTGCFADPDEALHVRSQLAERLCRAG